MAIFPSSYMVVPGLDRVRLVTRMDTAAGLRPFRFLWRPENALSWDTTQLAVHSLLVKNWNAGSYRVSVQGLALDPLTGDMLPGLVTLLHVIVQGPQSSSSSVETPSSSSSSQVSWAQTILGFSWCQISHYGGSAYCGMEKIGGMGHAWSRIGSARWMAQNMNVVPTAGKFWRYGDDEENSAVYGRLYDWEAAQTVCTGDWSLPGESDWNNLRLISGLIIRGPTGMLFRPCREERGKAQLLMAKTIGAVPETAIISPMTVMVPSIPGPASGIRSG